MLETERPARLTLGALIQTLPFIACHFVCFAAGLVSFPAGAGPQESRGDAGHPVQWW